MLEKPDLSDGKIITCLKREYGLDIDVLTFLPLGADMNTAVYRAVTKDNPHYFVKLRRGDFNRAAVELPSFLAKLGIKQIIPALTTQTGQLWANLESFKLILYPFVKGRNGFEVALTDQQRIEFGAALKALHTAVIPSTLTKNIQREQFSSRWRDTVKLFLVRIENETFDEPIAAELAAFLKIKRDETLELVEKAGRLALTVQAHSPEFILCHADIHAWNLLIDGSNGALYMVDWDTLIFAPKERDLMFVGSGLSGIGHSLQEEESLFYQGYGQIEIDHIGIAYYRYERIIEDIAVYCEQLFLSDEGGEDRQQALENVKSNFLPNGTIEIAYQAVKR